MHIPDGFLDAKTCFGTFAISAAGLGIRLRTVRSRWTDKTVPLMGVMSAFIFAGQTVNFPITGGTSGHLQGGVLAAVFLGPAGAGVVMASVLFVQCFLFQDGGVTALGANWLNLGWIGIGAGYWLFARLRRWFPERITMAAAVASWFSVVCAAAACSFELSASRTVPMSVGMPAMVASHALIGIGEALITAAMISFVAKVRPDLFYQSDHVGSRRSDSLNSIKPYLAFGFVFAIGIAVLVSPFASSLPDGLESLAVNLHLNDLIAPTRETAAMLPWIQRITPSIGAGLGTLAAFGVAWAIARRLRRPRPQTHVD